MGRAPDWNLDPPDDADADAAEQYAEENYDRLDEKYDEPFEDRDCDYWNRLE